MNIERNNRAFEPVQNLRKIGQGRQEIEYATKAFDRFINHLVTVKGISPEAVTQALREIAERSKKSPTLAALTAGNLTLYPGRKMMEKRLTEGSVRNVKLTNAEEIIIRTLMEYHGEIVPSELILAELGRESSLEVKPKTLQVHIWNIRHKLGDTKKPFRDIINANRRGYKIPRR